MATMFKKVVFDAEAYDDVLRAIDALPGLKAYADIDFGMGSHVLVTVDDKPDARVQVWHPKYDAAGENSWVIVTNPDGTVNDTQYVYDGDTPLYVLMVHLCTAIAAL